jgi:DHA1 family tetracycline resistance protein-like MFS transporter
VGADEQGRLQGAWASINAAMGLAAPALFAGLFAVAAAPGLSPAWLGSPFLLAAAMMAAAALLAFRTTRPQT